MTIQERVDELLKQYPELKKKKQIFLRVYYWQYFLKNMPASITKRIFSDETDNIETVLRSYRNSIRK